MDKGYTNAKIWPLVIRDISALLNNHPTIEHWMHWMSTIVDRYLKQYSPVSQTIYSSTIEGLIIYLI